METTTARQDLMTYEDLSSYLKLSVGYLRQLVMRREIPFKKLGRSVRFRKNEIDEWVEERTAESTVAS